MNQQETINTAIETIEQYEKQQFPDTILNTIEGYSRARFRYFNGREVTKDVNVVIRKTKGEAKNQFMNVIVNNGDRTLFKTTIDPSDKSELEEDLVAIERMVKHK